MKRKLPVVVAVLITVISTVSCKKTETYSLSVDYDQSTEISAEGGSATFNIMSDMKWAVTNDDSWIIGINTREGEGKGSVKVSFAPNNSADSRISVFRVDAGKDYEEVVIRQAAGELPDAAGIITESGLTEETATLTVDSIGKAVSYKWYKDNSVMQISSVRTLVATESGKYKVTGVNSIGEGEASPEIAVTISHYEGPLKFEDIPDAGYEASGVPSILSDPGPSSWTGTVAKVYDKQEYSISSWGGTDYLVNIRYRSDSLFIDDSTLVTSDEEEQYYGYFTAFFIAGENIYILEDFGPKYDKKSRTLDFSAEYENFPIWVAVLGYDQDMNFAGVAFSEGYEDCKMVLDSGEGRNMLECKSKLSGHIDLENLSYGGKIKIDPSKLRR
ncbi:MAG: BACON domain-containing protein [Bacteroidales bacterium]|jgi:hypothetical protein|nr:BACON domain-containing protein [Bacteroidales bacterium]MCI2144771.1 BACON domain-containing protein [Bacteroidales bacterium]